MTHRKTLLGALVLMLLAGGGSPAVAATPSPSPASAPGPSAAQQRATFGIQPAGARAPDTRPYLIYPVAPGAVIDDHAAVVNYSAQPLTLRVYATDAFNAADGSFSLLERKKPATAAGTWLRLTLPKGRDTVTVGPKSFAILPVRLTVPRDAEPGDHVAGLVAALASTSTNPRGANVELDQRVGVRTFVRVSGALRPQLAIENVTRTYHQSLNPLGRTTISYTVHNTGNVSLGGAQRVSARGPLGPAFPGTAIPDLPLLVPGGSLRITAQIPSTWPLFWMTGRVQISPALVSGVSSGDVPQFEDSGHYVAVPWSLLSLIALLVVLGITRRRRRRGKPVAAGTSGPKHVRGRHAVGAGTAARRVLVVVALTLVGLAPHAPVHAEGVPYVDPAVTGSIGLCDVNGKNVLSGKTTDKPFVWLAVGTTAAPPPYDAPGRTSFLAAYQPREGIAPGDWSGYQLAATSRYDTPANPAAQATPLGGALTEFLGRYPPQWQGHVQLRLILAGSDRAPRLTAYDATDLQIEGDTWRVVRGGTGPCGKGKATSTALILNLPGSTGTPKPGAVASPPPLKVTPVPQAVGQSALPAGASTGSASTEQQTDPAGIAGASTTALLVGGAATAGVAVFLTLWAVRRRSGAS